MAVLEFSVAMTCEGCSGAVKRVLDKHKDKIDLVGIDLAGGKVTVSTDMPPDEVRDIIAKTGKETKYLGSSS